MSSSFFLVSFNQLQQNYGLIHNEKKSVSEETLFKFITCLINHRSHQMIRFLVEHPIGHTY